MAYTSRSARRQVEAESFSSLGPEGRLRERESKQPRIHINGIEQPFAQVSCCLALTPQLTHALIRIWDVRRLQNLPVSRVTC